MHRADGQIKQVIIPFPAILFLFPNCILLHDIDLYSHHCASCTVFETVTCFCTVFHFPRIDFHNICTFNEPPTSAHITDIKQVWVSSTCDTFSASKQVLKIWCIEIGNHCFQRRSAEPGYPLQLNSYPYSTSLLMNVCTHKMIDHQPSCFHLVVSMASNVLPALMVITSGIITIH
jgi:hypothetical protein